MLQMVEKGIRGGIYHANHRYSKADNRCMKDYNKNKDKSYLMYWEANNLNRWTLFQKLPVNNFE